MPVRRNTVRLTAAREGWAATRAQAPRFKGPPLQYNAAIQSRYVIALQSLVAQMTTQVRREVLRLFTTPHARAHFDAAEFPTVDAQAREAALRAWVTGEDAAGPNVGSQARILMSDLNKRFNALFARKAGDLATRMVDDSTVASRGALHGSLSRLTGGLSLRTNIMGPKLRAVYKASVAQNVSLIKTIGAEYLQNVERAVLRSITTGNGLQDLVPALEQYEGYTHRKARNVALDQTRKTYNAINKGRMQEIGVKRFTWIHSGGGAHPREDHIAMDGQVFSFDNPPVIDQRTGERGIPGQAINCRCTMAPVFDFGDDKENDAA